MGAPIVNPITSYVMLNQSVLASTLFSASDPDGDAITQYRFRDLSATTSSGFMRYNGVALANGSITTVAAADLSKLSFVAGSVVGNENFQIEVFANGQWSTPANALVYFVRNNVTPPVVTTTNPTVLQDELVTLSSFIAAADPDGWPIEKFFLRDQAANPSSGYILLNGVAQAQGTYRYYTPTEFSQLQYFAVNKTEKERIEVYAWDGAQWSSYKFAVPNVLANINAPTAFYGDKAVRANTSNAISQALGWNDADGNTIKWVEFFDTNSVPTSGALELNGTRLSAGVWHRVAAQDFASMRFYGAQTQTDDLIKYRVWDGRYLSASADLRLRTIVQPQLENLSFHQTSLWTMQATPMVIRVDDGPSYQTFQFVDLNVASTSGGFRLGNSTRAAGVIHTISAAQLPQLTFRTGVPEFRSLDQVAFRAWNGTFWGAWVKHDIKTEPNYRHALKQLVDPFNMATMEANDWNDWLQQVGATPSHITYSFDEQFDGVSDDGATVDNFSQFTPAQRAMAREAFRQVSEFSNVTYEEVPDSSTNPFFQQGGITRMSNYANPDGLAAAYAGFPGGNDFAGDIKMNIAFTSTTAFGTQPGTPTFETFIHELGHTLGLKHPHDGNPRLPAVTDNALYSVMTYNGNPATPGVNYHSLYDVISIQDLYGANMTTRTGDDLYDIAGYFNGNDNWMGTIWDAGGNDTFSIAGAQLDSILDLRQGGRSSFGTTFNPFTGLTVLTQEHVGVAFNCDIENAIGSSNNDQIFGNYLANTINGGAGNDTIMSGAGNDTVTGGSGDDIFGWGVGEGNDVINENALAGRDRINMLNFPSLDNFTQDLSFRRLGLDLLVELALDNGEVESSLRVVNQAWGGYRVETLRFNGVDVDLNSVYAQTTAASRRFAISATSSIFGFLANPV